MSVFVSVDQCVRDCSEDSAKEIELAKSSYGDRTFCRRTLCGKTFGLKDTWPNGYFDEFLHCGSRNKLPLSDKDVDEWTLSAE